MAVVVYNYQKVTHEQLENCIKWCQNKFNLRDWKISLETGENYPEQLGNKDDDDIGSCFSNPDFLKVTIWVPILLHKKERITEPAVTLIVCAGTVQDS